MSPGTRSWIVRLLLLALVFTILREISIRRHEADLHDWPRPGAPEHNGA